MKTLSLSLLSAALVLGGLTLSQPALALDKKPAAEKPAKKKSVFFPFRGNIKALDAEKGTLTLPGAKGKPDRVFALVENGKLTLDGKKASLKDIKVGMYVGGRAKRISETKVEAHTINVRTKAPERKKKPKKTDS